MSSKSVISHTFDIERLRLLKQYIDEIAVATEEDMNTIITKIKKKRQEFNELSADNRENSIAVAAIIDPKYKSIL